MEPGQIRKRIEREGELVGVRGPIKRGAASVARAVGVRLDLVAIAVKRAPVDVDSGGHLQPALQSEQHRQAMV